MFEPGKTYVFFSHRSRASRTRADADAVWAAHRSTMSGGGRQEPEADLFRLARRGGRMIDTLGAGAAVGLGRIDNPFAERQTRTYHDLAETKEALGRVRPDRDGRAAHERRR